MIKHLPTPARVQNYWNRQDLIRYFFILLFIGFAYRIIIIHQLPAGDISLQERAAKQSKKILIEHINRGDILDRNGDILASDLVLKKVNLDPSLVQVEFIPKLAKALQMEEVVLSKKLAQKRKINSKHLIIKKNIKLTSPIISNIKTLRKHKINICRKFDKKIQHNWFEKILVYTKLKKQVVKTKTYCEQQTIHGVALQQDSQRYYPKGPALAALLGRINQDKRGISGIEGDFNQALSGVQGKAQLYYQQNSKHAYFNPTTLIHTQLGKNITLTIDSTVQFHTFSALKHSVKKHQAESGSAIVLAPNGEILAMANYPADDPNDKTSYNPQHYRNRVLSDKIEPGSTMKPFTMLLALDKNKISAADNELIDVSKRIGHIKPDGKYTQMNIKKILQKSHNLGTVNVAERLSKQDMYETWDKLGFGHSLGLLPSIENSGSLKHYHSWGLADKRTLSFGHGPMETNLAQLARAYLVFANKGGVPPLKLVKNTRTGRRITPVFTAKSTAKIADILDSVASNDGSGYRAVIKGYDIAGKTGTAEMVVNGGYSKKGAKRTFFVGFAPVKKPKYIMAIRLDHPKKCFASWDPSIKIKCEGSNSASIAFRDAMHNILANDRSIKLLVSN